MTASPNRRSATHRPGERAEATGVYRAVHLRHRMPHEITVLEGEIFPLCKRCGEHVRFELIHAAPRLTGDVDLLLALCSIGAALFMSCGLH
ncbi:MAG: hypothetical protein ACRD3E_04080 [Terriglobales bacterium]